MIQIERYKGIEADVNSYLLSDAENVIAVDVLRNSTEAEKLADHLEASGKRLICIFITHGHPDHYIGLGVFHRRFPDVPVKVASVEIRDDIIAFSQWMESVGWFEKEAHMKARSETNPDGFDYAHAIGILDVPFLKLPLVSNRIQVRTDYPGSECGHMTTLTVAEQKAFLASDFLYDKVHAWCGEGVDRREIHNWITVLDEMLQMASGNGWIFYAGHGGKGDENLVKDMKGYLQKFLEVTASENTKQGAIHKMKRFFPEFTQDDFLLVHSVDFHVKEEG